MNLEELTQEGLDELISSKETAETKVGELTGQLGERDTKLGEVQGELETKAAAITELEQTVAGKDTLITELATSATGLEAEVKTLTDSLSEAVSAYKSAAAAANPTVPGELITGDTIEAINLSLESAKGLVAQVRQSVEADIASGKVPAGAPARTAPDVEALSPREKIQYAITKGGK